MGISKIFSEADIRRKGRGAFARGASRRARYFKRESSASELAECVVCVVCVVCVLRALQFLGVRAGCARAERVVRGVLVRAERAGA